MVLYSTFAFSQIKKNYDGKYRNGIAKYEFYELDGKQIFDGNFLYSINKTHSETGKFLKNSKIGLWKFFYKNDYKTINISGNYNNNLKTGKWSFTVKDDKLKKQFFITFLNDTIIDKIELIDLQGQFDNKGRFIDDWKISDNGAEYNAKFQDNILTNLQYRTKYGTITGIYEPNISKEIFNNNISVIKKEYELDWNLRLQSNQFDIDQIYDINRVELLEVDKMEYIEKELFFSNFFDKITDKINSNTFDNIGWEFLQRVELKVNPYFLYLNVQRVAPKKNISEAKLPNNGLNIFFDNKLVDEKPVFKNGNDKFIKYITENYRGFEEVSGKAFIEFVIDKKGKLNVLTIRASGSISEIEIRRVLNNSPEWKPGIKEGKIVEVKYSIPINIVKK